MNKDDVNDARRHFPTVLTAKDPPTEETMVQRFTAYRTSISGRDTHNSLQKNPDDVPQYEGVIWSDGTVSLRWLTACRSTSVWANLNDMLNIHGHPEYGTQFVWHDGPAPAEWLQKVSDYRLKRIAELMEMDPPKDSQQGRELIRLAGEQESYERTIFP